LVGEFFEVRTQVDRDLTTVSRVDRRLGLIKTWSVTSIFIKVLILKPYTKFEFKPNK
jgi:hypothetical protein